jgi:nitroreductase
MSGLIFYKTEDLEMMDNIYSKKIGMELWLDQGGCKIYRHNNMLLGFCDRGESEVGGMITFFYDSDSEVDKLYQKFRDSATTEPRFNPDYNIYHFFAKDPEGRVLEFQVFKNQDLKPFKSLSEGLLDRRSIRKFKDIIPSKDLITSILTDCITSPTSMNSESFRYKVIYNRELISRVADEKAVGSDPLRNAPVAVVIFSDREKTKRDFADANIAAYHLILSAYNHGLGSCWIAGLDNDRVYDLLSLDKERYCIGALTPLGYPDEKKQSPQKRKVEDLFEIIE